jgi:hypothetical protein
MGCGEKYELSFLVCCPRIPPKRLRNATKNFGEGILSNFYYLFLIYLKMRSVLKIVQCKIIAWCSVMSWRGCASKWSCPNLRYYAGILVEGLRKTMKTFNQDSRCSGRNSNRAPPEYKSEAFLNELTCPG